MKTNDVPSVERPDEKSVVSQLRYSLQKITADVVILHSTKEREIGNVMQIGGGR